MTRTRTTFLVIAIGTLALLGGCIVSDELVTLTILPDGSAELVKFRSNIRSTETGARAAEEMRRFADDFNARRDSDHRQVTEAGGEVVESRWVQRDGNHATLLVARLPDVSALEKYFTFTDESGEAIVRPSFTRSGSRRKLALVITPPKDRSWVDAPAPTAKETRQNRANGISETRIVVAGGRIVDSRGFTVAADRGSALVNAEAIRELLQPAKEPVELFVEWELARD